MPSRTTGPVASDEEIFARLDAGDDRAAHALLVVVHRPRVHAYCARMLRSAALADDTCQQVFEQALAGLAAFGRRAQLSSWLFGIARHRCLDALKRSRRHRRRFVATTPATEPTAADGTPDERLHAARMRRVLDECIAGLAPGVRSAIVLHYEDEMSFARMATLLRVKAGTLQARIARALPLLREELVSRGIAP